MPRLTAAQAHQQYAPPTPDTLGANAAMTYYTRSTMGQTYYGDAAPSPLPTMAPYDQYAVGPAPLAMPASSGGPVGGPVGSSSLPAQHRASSGAWSQSDDQTLIAARQSGQNWTQIQSAYFPTKTPNACRKRHERLMERRGADDWDTRKMEQIAKEYMAMRKEIWQPLAQRTGQKWHVVEQKCMSNGLKNLQAHARSYSRKQRNGQSSTDTGYDDDGAVGGLGLTPDDDVDPDDDGGYVSPNASPSTASSSRGIDSSSTGGNGATGSSSSLHQPHDQYDSLPAMHASTSFQGYPHHAAYGHTYTSSVSSAGTPAYATTGGAVGGHASYADGHYPGSTRQSSLDMDIRAIINKPPVGGRRGV